MDATTLNNQEKKNSFGKNILICEAKIEMYNDINNLKYSEVGKEFAHIQ